MHVPEREAQDTVVYLTETMRMHFWGKLAAEIMCIWAPVDSPRLSHIDSFPQLTFAYSICNLFFHQGSEKERMQDSETRRPVWSQAKILLH